MATNDTNSGGALGVGDPKLEAKTFDFTKRKRWPDLLVTELSGVIILVLSTVGHVLFCSEAAKEMLGWKEEVVDLKLSHLIHRQSYSFEQTGASDPES